jgi:hypothetical protein
LRLPARARTMAFVLLLCLLGCASIHRRYVVGTWTMRADSELPANLPRIPASFTFSANGTFTALRIPGFFYFPGQRSMRLESGSGTWRLVTRESRQQVQLDFQKIENWKGGLPFGAQLEISGKRLFYFIGDPDEGKIMVFEKK